MVSKSNGQERKFAEVTASVAERVGISKLSREEILQEYPSPVRARRPGGMLSMRLARRRAKVTRQCDDGLARMGDAMAEYLYAPSEVQPSEYAHCLLMWLGSNSAVEWDEAA